MNGRRRTMSDRCQRALSDAEVCRQIGTMHPAQIVSADRPSCPHSFVFGQVDPFADRQRVPDGLGQIRNLATRVVRDPFRPVVEPARIWLRLGHVNDQHLKALARVTGGRFSKEKWGYE
jgi:hypothetical protein